MADDVTVDYDICQAFRWIDWRLGGDPEAPTLLALRSRLAGELLGDGERIAATLADGFELVTVANGTRTITSGKAMVESLGRLGPSLMWIELDDLVVEGSTIAGQGLLRTLAPTTGAPTSDKHQFRADDTCLTSIPLAYFLHFDGNLMVSETFYMDTGCAEVTALSDSPLPTVDELRDLIDGPGRE